MQFSTQTQVVSDGANRVVASDWTVNLSALSFINLKILFIIIKK